MGATIGGAFGSLVTAIYPFEGVTANHGIHHRDGGDGRRRAPARR